MVLKTCWEKLVSDIYMIAKASVWMMYNDQKQGNHLGNISGVLKIHLISEMVVCGSLCYPHQRVGSLISYCHAFFWSVHSNLLCNVWCQAYVLQQRLCAFLCPMDFGRFYQWSLSRDCNDFNCGLWWLSDSVGRCSIARPWFSQGLVGLKALPLHL